MILTVLYYLLGAVFTIAALRKLEIFFNQHKPIEETLRDEPIKKPVKVTKWMVFKAWLAYRQQLLKVFFLKFFSIRELVYVEFTYTYFKNHTPKRDTYLRLAKVSRVTPLERVKKLFDKKIDGVKLNVTGVRIIPINEIPKV